MMLGIINMMIIPVTIKETMIHVFQNSSRLVDDLWLNHLWCSRVQSLKDSNISCRIIVGGVWWDCLGGVHNRLAGELEKSEPLHRPSRVPHIGIGMRTIDENKIHLRTLCKPVKHRRKHSKHISGNTSSKNQSRQLKPFTRFSSLSRSLDPHLILCFVKNQDFVLQRMKISDQSVSHLVSHFRLASNLARSHVLRNHCQHCTCSFKRCSHHLGELSSSWQCGGRQGTVFLYLQALSQCQPLYEFAEPA